MEIPNKNQHEALPYDKLALLGIDRESAERLFSLTRKPSQSSTSVLPKSKLRRSSEMLNRN